MVDDDDRKEWKLYDCGPRSVKCPLICFPPASGTADVYFKQMLSLSSAGIRIISVRNLFPMVFYLSWKYLLNKLPLVYNNLLQCDCEARNFPYVNHTVICSWNQPVLSNEGKVLAQSNNRGFNGV